MAPSNSKNMMTRPLSNRPSQRAGFEAGASPAIVGMASPMDRLSCMFIARLLRISAASSKDERDRRRSTASDKNLLIFRHYVTAAGAKNELCPLHSNFGLKFALDSMHCVERNDGVRS